MLKIYTEDISLIDSKEKFDFIFDSLPKYRQEKVLKYKLERDQYLSLLAGKLLIDGLKELGLCMYLDKIKVEENGKPYIEDNSIYFSISHSGTKAMVAFSDTDVGCDIQLMKKDSISLADKYFTDEEQKEIKNSDNPVETFYKFWTLKECFMKISGLGLSQGLKNIDVNDKNYESKSYIVDEEYMVSCVNKKKI